MNKTGLTSILLALVIVAGCAAPIKGTGPYNPAIKNDNAGQRYYVGKDIILVTADVTEKFSPVVDDDLNVSIKHYTNATATISKKLVPDYRQYFKVKLKAAGMYDDSIKVVTTSEGLLTSVSADSTGKAGEVINNIGKVAANIFSLTPVLAAIPPNLEDNCVKGAQGLGLSNEHQLFALENKNGCLLIERLTGLRDTSNQLRQGITSLRQKIASTEDNEALKNLKAALSIKSQELENTVKEIESNNKIYDALFTIYKSKTLAEKENKWTLNETFELDELPSDTDIVLLVGNDEASTLSALNNSGYSKMAYVLEKTKMLFTKKLLTPSDSKYFSNESTVFPKMNEMPDNRIYFRQSHPIFVGEYKLQHPVGKNGEPRLLKKSNSIVSVMHPNSNIQFVEYDASQFAQRKLELTFDAETNSLTSIQTTNKSSAAAASSSISKTITDMQKEYVAALTNIESAQKKLTSIELNDYSKEIEELKKKKELIDAQVAFEGAEATQELLIEQKLLDQKLITLKSDLALKQAESTFDQKLGFEKVSADLQLLSKQLEFSKKEITYEQQLEIEKLRSEILVLQERLKLIEQQAKENP